MLLKSACLRFFCLVFVLVFVFWFGYFCGFFFINSIVSSRSLDDIYMAVSFFSPETLNIDIAKTMLPRQPPTCFLSNIS